MAPPDLAPCTRTSSYSRRARAPVAKEKHRKRTNGKKREISGSGIPNVERSGPKAHIFFGSGRPSALFSLHVRPSPVSRRQIDKQLWDAPLAQTSVPLEDAEERGAVNSKSRCCRPSSEESGDRLITLSRTREETLWRDRRGESADFDFFFRNLVKKDFLHARGFFLFFTELSPAPAPPIHHRRRERRRRTETVTNGPIGLE